MKKALIGLIIPIASFLYRNKRYTTNVVPAKANLGCGLLCEPGWINVDGSLTSLLGSTKFSWFNKILYRLAGSSAWYSFEEFDRIIRTSHMKFYDLRRGVPLPDASVDVIFASHFLEHLRKPDGRKFIKECHRALKKGGLMRILVPDLDIAFELFEEGKVEEMEDLFFYNAEHYDFSAHKYNYNFASLKRALEEVGFTEVKKWKYQEGECPDIATLDVYPEHSLYVECRK